MQSMMAGLSSPHFIVQKATLHFLFKLFTAATKISAGHTGELMLLMAAHLVSGSSADSRRAHEGAGKGSAAADILRVNLDGLLSADLLRSSGKASATIFVIDAEDASKA